MRRAFDVVSLKSLIQVGRDGFHCFHLKEIGQTLLMKKSSYCVKGYCGTFNPRKDKILISWRSLKLVHVDNEVTARFFCSSKENVVIIAKSINDSQGATTDCVCVLYLHKNLYNPWNIFQFSHLSYRITNSILKSS